MLATDEAIYAVGFFFPDADYRLVIGVDPETAGLGSWDPRPNNLYYSVPLVSDGQRLFVGGEHYAVVAPSGRAIAVFEREGFSRFTQIDLGPPLTKLSLSVDQGRQVIVERTTDFSTWTGVSTNMAWEGLVELLDPRPPSTLPAFYRAGTNQPQ